MRYTVDWSMGLRNMWTRNSTLWATDPSTQARNYALGRFCYLRYPSVLGGAQFEDDTPPPYGFDAAVMDIYGALLNCACLCPFDIREQLSADAIRNDLIERRVSVYHSTPTVYRFLFADSHESFAGIRLVVLGGEQARLPDLEIC